MLTPMLRIFFFLGLAFGLFSLVFGLSSYLGRQAVINELVAATETEDADLFAQRVSWEELRAFLKDDIPGRLDGMRKMLGGLALGPSPAQVPDIVDYYVQPENIEVLFLFREQFFADVPVTSFIHDSGWDTPYGFYITLGYPLDHPMPDAMNISMPANMLRVRLVYRLRGMTWRLTAMHVPPLLMPRRTYDRPLREVFLPGR